MKRESDRIEQANVDCAGLSNALLNSVTAEVCGETTGKREGEFSFR